MSHLHELLICSMNTRIRTHTHTEIHFYHFETNLAIFKCGETKITQQTINNDEMMLDQKYEIHRIDTTYISHVLFSEVIKTLSHR